MIKKVVKRDGITIVDYNAGKIRSAIEKANTSVPPSERLSPDDITDIIQGIEADADSSQITVEEIQDMVEQRLFSAGYYKLARNYITYRYKRALVRQKNTTDDDILSLLRGENEDTSRENSNKNATVNSTQRDLIAGEVSKDITKRLLLPDYIVEAHEKGIIHFHDMDYFMQPEFNCCLPNFRDMLENGTTIHGVQIETPKSFRVACNQITQAMADISSNQYGGQTCYVDVLGKYLAITRDKFEKRIRKNIEESQMTQKMTSREKEVLVQTIVKEELQIELSAGIQCIQYQINTLMTTNGQAPFVTLFMYLRDDDPYIEENAMIFEEIFKQRYEGFKNKQGVPVTPAFPKLVYVIGKNNCLQGGKYDYLTHLAAKCTAKRMYPDYISEKVMMENYDGEVFGCMGCVDGNEVVKYRYLGEYNFSTFEDFWNEMSSLFTVRKQGENTDNLFMDTPEGLEIWDTKKGWVKNRRIVRNMSSEWCAVTLENGVTFHCTVDHPLRTYNRGVVEAGKLNHMGDYLIYNKNHKSHMNRNPEDAYDDGTIVSVKDVRFYRQKKYSYDVTTLSDHFEVSGIYSHNCRSFLSAYKDPKTGEIQWEGRLTTKVKSTLNSVNVRKNGVLVA